MTAYPPPPPHVLFKLYAFIGWSPDINIYKDKIVFSLLNLPNGDLLNDNLAGCVAEDLHFLPSMGLYTRGQGQIIEVEQYSRVGIVGHCDGIFLLFLKTPTFSTTHQ